MFLGAYHFDGDPAALLPAYERLLAGLPPDASDLHVGVVRDGGISIYDTCPDRPTFEHFSGSAQFAAAVAAAGLPQPRVDAVGEVHTVRVTEAVR